MEPDIFYHDMSRRLQRQFGTEELAAHLARKYVLDELEQAHIEWIGVADEVYIATVNPQGHPECSYKGGLPGFIRVVDTRTLEIPSYDGNGMYRTLGNITAEPWIGLLLLFPEVPAKLRVNGSCQVRTGSAALAAHPGAEALIQIRVREVFENCPRYLHDRQTSKHSVHCPRPGYQPPDPAWKLKPEYAGLLPVRHH